MESNFIVYALIDPNTNEIRYVGKSCSGMRRVKRHFRPSELKNDLNTHKKNWIQKLMSNGQLPVVNIVQSLYNHEQVAQAEIYWIKYFKDAGCNLINLTYVDEVGTVRLSDQTKEKLSKSIKELHQTEEFRQKQKNGIENYFLKTGRKRKIPKEKIGLQAYWQDPEFREKQILHRKRNWENIEYREKMTNLRFVMNKKCRIMDQNGVIYNSCKEASEILGITRSGISNVLNGKIKTTGGYTFKKLDEWY